MPEYSNLWNCKHHLGSDVGYSASSALSHVADASLLPLLLFLRVNFNLKWTFANFRKRRTLFAIQLVLAHRRRPPDPHLPLGEAIPQVFLAIRQLARRFQRCLAHASVLADQLPEVSLSRQSTPCNTDGFLSVVTVTLDSSPSTSGDESTSPVGRHETTSCPPPCRPDTPWRSLSSSSPFNTLKTAISVSTLSSPGGVTQFSVTTSTPCRSEVPPFSFPRVELSVLHRELGNSLVCRWTGVVIDYRGFRAFVSASGWNSYSIRNEFNDIGTT
jgi:hypothetical protein